MKVKWFLNKFTFMIIPDNNPSKSVLRFRIYGLFLYVLFFVFLASLVFSYIIYSFHGKSSVINSELAIELSDQEQLFTETVSSKNMTIEQLQNKVIELAEQATDIQIRIGVMQKLENEVRMLTNSDKSAKKADKAESGVIQEGGSESQGGPLVSISEDQILTLADATQDKFKALDTEMTTLFGTLEQTKLKVMDTIKQLKVTPTIWPVNTRYITSGFGYRKDPFTYRPTIHNGFDIAGNFNDPVYATADGVVSASEYDKAHGNNIIINHSKGLRTWYMHLNKSLVSKGDTVSKGDKIGLLGSTGRSTGPHLHYEVKLNGVSVDPEPYLLSSRREE